MGCTFCAIPQFRGRHRSRPLADIVAEVNGLARRGHPGSDPGLAGHAGLRARSSGQRRHRRPAAGALRHDDAVDPADVPAPRARHRAPRRQVAARARGAVPRHAGAARRRRDPARHAPRRHRAAHEGRRRPAAGRDPRRHAPHHRARGLPGRDRGRVPQPARLRGGRGLRPARASSPTRWRRARRPPTCRIRCRPRSWPSAPSRCRTSRTAWRGRARRRSSAPVRRCWWTGRAPDPAFPFEGRTAGQAPEIDGVVLLRDRTLTPGRFAEVAIVEVEGYELVGE